MVGISIPGVPDLTGTATEAATGAVNQTLGGAANKAMGAAGDLLGGAKDAFNDLRTGKDITYHELSVRYPETFASTQNYLVSRNMLDAKDATGEYNGPTEDAFIELASNTKRYFPPGQHVGADIYVNKDAAGPDKATFDDRFLFNVMRADKPEGVNIANKYITAGNEIMEGPQKGGTVTFTEGYSYATSKDVGEYAVRHIPGTNLREPTEAEIIAIQKSLDIPADGKMGPNTIQKFQDKYDKPVAEIYAPDYVKNGKIMVDDTLMKEVADKFSSLDIGDMPTLESSNVALAERSNAPAAANTDKGDRTPS